MSPILGPPPPLAKPPVRSVIPFPTWQDLAASPPRGSVRFTCPVTGIRFYAVPSHRDPMRMLAVPGVTSILSNADSNEDKERLSNWRKREIAEGRNPDRARNRGTAMHDVLERYVRGEVRILQDVNEESPESVRYASGMEKHIQRYDDFLWSERPLIRGWEHCWSPPDSEGKKLARVWSSVWGFAGTPDLIAKRNKRTCLSDYKSSDHPYFRSPGRKVPRHRIVGYKKYKKTVKQLCAYKLAIEETLDITIDDLQIIVGLPGIGEAQMFYINPHEVTVETENLKRAARIFWLKREEMILEQAAAA